MLTARRALVITVPLCVAVGYAAMRDVRVVTARNAEAIVGTFPAQAVQTVTFPGAGMYWVFGAGSRESLKDAAAWDISAHHRETKAAATIGRPEERRAKGRENRAALDMLFTIAVPAPGEYALRLTPDGRHPGPVNVRITRFVSANAGTAMRAFGFAALFSGLLVVNAVLWFRGAAV